MPWDTALVVPTSGTTGDPRLACLSRAALATSADLTHHALGGPGRWLLALPTTHIAGLQVLGAFTALRTRASGARPRPSRSRPSGSRTPLRLDVSRSEHPHYTALVPTQLQRLLDDGAGIEALWQLDAVLVGGGAVAPIAARTGDRCWRH